MSGPSQCCVQGVHHEGTPTGKIEKINDVECYIATPSATYPKEKVLLFLPDFFGITFKNAQLIADDFARNGYRTVMPDYLNGDGVPPAELEKGTFPVQDWFQRHGPETSRPPLDKVIAGLREEGVTAFAAIGYCYGARHAWDLAIEHVTKVTICNHPSLLKNPEDFETYLAKATAPLLINSCEIDPPFPPDFQASADEILKDKFAPGYHREHWMGCKHGFSVRGDIRDPMVKAAKEGSFVNAVEWLHKHF
ncbi:alpha beta-hydrolase [Coniophora puteana RWD-64-598 SS2]|uniref:Alpha beta-hydrolase n=1 Tax=Coniophora puteana (strain RWD-64-598) TaxID=741705 RepID=A0A5M3MJB5_CONPW|nr:alpha beta-hydrolase [Coniophora puteana RWD-64-598 SS2]EIW79020.1 alpha beta-hydrolase [Coniophora puteana RWD-64-598 SS2]